MSRRAKSGPIGLFLALLFLLIPQAAHAAPGDDKLAAVQKVLDARAAAVRGGDKAGFLATVDPQAPAEFKDAQGQLFDGLHGIPLSTYTLTARLTDSGDLSAATRGRYDVPTYLPETRQRMRLKDYDGADAADSLWLTFVLRPDDKWYVGGDNDVSLLGVDTARGLWDFGPVTVQSTPHFLLLSHPAEAPRAKALGGIAEEAIAALSTRWTLSWPGKIPLVLPATTTELSAILQTTVDINKFVAFVSYGAVRDSGYEPTAPRVYIQDQNLAKYNHEFQLETLTHELTHAAVAPISGPFIPAWVHEGLADWIALGRSTTEKRPAGSDPGMPRDFQFVTGDQAGIVKAYAEARSAMSVLAAAKGVDAPTAFMKELGGVHVAPGTTDYQTDAALQRSSGLSVADLESLWAK